MRINFKTKFIYNEVRKQKNKKQTEAQQSPKQKNAKGIWKSTRQYEYKQVRDTCKNLSEGGDTRRNGRPPSSPLENHRRSSFPSIHQKYWSQERRTVEPTLVEKDKIKIWDFSRRISTTKKLNPSKPRIKPKRKTLKELKP